MIPRRGAFITWESTVPISSPTEAISLMGLGSFGQEVRRFNGTNTNVSHVASIAVSENNLS